MGELSTGNDQFGMGELDRRVQPEGARARDRHDRWPIGDAQQAERSPEEFGMHLRYGLNPDLRVRHALERRRSWPDASWEGLWQRRTSSNRSVDGQRASNERFERP